MKRAIILLAILALGGVSAFAQQKTRGEALKQEVQLGRGMSLIAPGLIQVGAETNFFLLLADEISLTTEQQAALEAITYEFQKYGIQKQADLRVADAELERLLTRENIDLGSVRAKIREAEAVATEVKIRKIEALLKAINALVHEQHLKIVTLYREPPPPKPRLQTERVQ